MTSDMAAATNRCSLDRHGDGKTVGNDQKTSRRKDIVNSEKKVVNEGVVVAMW